MKHKEKLRKGNEFILKLVQFIISGAIVFGAGLVIAQLMGWV